MTALTANATMAPPATYPTTAAVDVVAMRHKTFDPALLGAIDAVEILSQPSIGRAILQGDGTIVVNLDGSGQITGSTSFTYRVTQGDETTDCTLDVTILAAGMLQGWGRQLHGFLPVDDATGKWQLVKGEGHKDWFIDSVAGLTLQDIATAEGVSVGAVDGDFLIANHPTYGGTQASAINVDAAFELHKDTPDRAHSTYHLKRGGDYTGLQEEFGKRGRSAIYRSTITNYGTGPRPIVRGTARTFGNGGYTLHEGLSFDKGTVSSLSGGPFTGVNMCELTAESNIQGSPYYVMMNCSAFDIVRTEPPGGDPDWASNSFAARKSGIFLADSVGAALVSNFFDHNAWGPDYDALGSYDPANNGSDQPPSQFSHNIYQQGDASSISIWACLSSRAPSQAIQGRNLGSSFENIMFSNPIPGNILGKGDPGKTSGHGNFSLSHGDIITQGFGHDPIPPQNPGGQNWGINWAAAQLSLVDSLVVHHNDPNDPTDTTAPDGFGIKRDATSLASGGKGPFFEGSTWLNYRWGEPDGSADGLIPDNSSGIDPAIADTYTIQRYTDGLLSRTAGTTTGVEDLINHLRGLEDFRSFSGDIVDYFTEGMIAAGQADLDARTTRTTPATITFRADPTGRTSGKWWYASRDWDADRGDYPGRVAMDSADLQGHRVDASVPHAMTLNNLSLGNDGGLTVGGGKISVTGTLSGTGYIGTTVAGQLEFAGYSGADKIAATTAGGLLANTGTVAGNLDVTVGGQEFPSMIGHPFNTGYVLLASGGHSMTFGAGDTLEVKGYAIAALDGTSGTATVNFDPAALLKFTAVTGANATQNPAGLGVLRAFQTGLYGDTPPAITSVVNLNDVSVEIDTTGLATGTYTVLEVDQLNGELGTVTGGTIAKVGNRLEITV